MKKLAKKRTLPVEISEDEAKVMFDSYFKNDISEEDAVAIVGGVGRLLYWLKEYDQDAYYWAVEDYIQNVKENRQNTKLLKSDRD